jgi:hypothetical protein
MQLSADPSVGRRNGLGGTDARKLIEGDWLGVYNEKMGITPSPDLDDVFPVQLGKHTEEFHAQWFAKRSGLTVVAPQEDVYTHPEHPFMFGHIDRWIMGENTFLEMKHSHGQASLREAALIYMPQLAHYAAITGVRECWFSVIPGNQEPLFGKVELTETYIRHLIEVETAFWWYVESKIPPGEQAPMGRDASMKHEAKSLKIDGLRGYDFTNRNEFSVLAGDWLANKTASQIFDKATKGLKEQVPADAAEVLGIGIVIKRDKANRLSIKELNA